MRSDQLPHPARWPAGGSFGSAATAAVAHSRALKSFSFMPCIVGFRQNWTSFLSNFRDSDNTLQTRPCGAVDAPHQGSVTV